MTVVVITKIHGFICNQSQNRMKRIEWNAAGIRKASARRGRSAFLPLSSQLNSCFLDRKHRTIDSRNLDFMNLTTSLKKTQHVAVGKWRVLKVHILAPTTPSSPQSLSSTDVAIASAMKTLGRCRLRLEYIIFLAIQNSPVLMLSKWLNSETPGSVGKL